MTLEIKLIPIMANFLHSSSQIIVGIGILNGYISSFFFFGAMTFHFKPMIKYLNIFVLSIMQINMNNTVFNLIAKQQFDERNKISN